MRATNVPLNDHLYRISRADSRTCPSCGIGPETVFHFLLQCPAHAAARARHLSQSGRRDRNLSAVLNSSTPRPPCAPIATICGRHPPVPIANVTPKEQPPRQNA
ncbi:hypothetical protein BD309DRAFT_213563 [Dichomitus squalens]|nr:hypothetical protein BD309DRAFT_213563 [Dichomitus squalens]